ncbi:MAG: isoamylase [Parachlamydiaceae bacterium]|nr:isoamylase [Parachlamydiaceae bacterium]
MVAMEKKKSELSLSHGTPFPYGATLTDHGINFSIYVKNALQITLVLFTEENLEQPFQEIELDPTINKCGNVWHIFVQNLTSNVAYAFRISKQDDQTPLMTLDPYAKALVSHYNWEKLDTETYAPLGKVINPPEFDWENDQPPRIPMQDLIIYEMHVRGFTQDESSHTKNPGTFLGIIEKIPYLKDLGINAIELLPVFEFNETEALNKNPKTNQNLCNYFGYSTVNFFSLMNRYAYDHEWESIINEFKLMVKELHKNGIEVILDVVYNHTNEGNQDGPAMSFKNLDKNAYYMVDADGNYLNFSGCGNTFNANHPVTREYILDSLRYWVTEMHVDGFRFDLSTILARSENGTPLNNAPVIEAISLDPILSETKLIAEAWDAGGLYQVGTFYPGTRWAEWNGRYRDVVRRFIKGTPNHKTVFATAVCGSQDLYGWRNSPICSVNFITAHDGFSLADLVSYNEKHNTENGEDNRDGFDHNDSWNCGVEGNTTNKKIIQLRERQMRNLFVALMVSQGIPMLVMGDEYAHTRYGNNNTWCQDNQLNWFLWDKIDFHPGFHRFYRAVIDFRNQHPILKNPTFLTEEDISWHGIHPFHPDWDNDNRFIAFSLNSKNKKDGIYVAFNASHVPLTIHIPTPEKGQQWRWVINTWNPPPDDFFDEELRKPLFINSFRIQPNSAILLEQAPAVKR